MQDEKVRETNNDAIECRLSAIQQGYLSDPYTSLFLKRTNRKAPIINRGTYVRSKGIDQYLSKFINLNPIYQVISLGAGSDSRYFLLKVDFHF